MAIFKDGLIRQGAAGASTVYTIDQSIRFNDDDTAYMSKTFTSSNRRTLTFSCWVKLGNLSINRNIFGPQTNNSGSGTYGALRLNPQNELDIFDYTNGTTNWRLQSTQLLRDPSAWYHIVFSMDTTNSISSERLRMYINGQRVNDFDVETYPSLDYQGQWNNNLSHEIGAIQRGSTNQYFDGYLAEIHFLDGYAYGPEYFGVFNSSNIWIPKQYTGSYGTNGFYIDGSDSSDLGKNVATGNTFASFASTNFQTNDQRADTPTNNQITFNPLNNQRSGGTPSNGNLDYVGPGTRTNISLTANIPSTGKWVVAYKVAQVSTGSGWQIGISTANDSDFGDAVGSNEDLDLIRMQPTSSDLYINDAVNGSGIDPSLPITTSDEFWVAVDMDSGNVYLGIYDESATAMKWVANDNGLDGDPATGANPTVTFNTTQMPRDNVVFSVGSKQTSQHIYLQRSTEVSGTIPTGYTYFENVKDLL